jgi:DNA-binding MarR family transcriptional regulator
VVTSLSPAEVASHLRLAVARTARRLRQDAFEAEGRGVLSPTLTAALATTELHGPLTPSELAERERVKRPTATRSVASLERLGLVSRTPDPADGRAFLVATTAEGRALLRRLRTRKNAYLAKRLRDLDPDEVATLERAATILERLLDEERPLRGGLAKGEAPRARSVRGAG